MTDDDRHRRRVFSSPLGGDDFRPAPATVRVDIGARSHAGVARTGNDDHFLVLRFAREQETVMTSLPAADVPGPFSEQGYAMLVADGMGEHGAGSMASRIALSSIAHLALHHGRWNLRIDSQTAREVFERAEWYYARADEEIVARSRAASFLKGMSTALTVAYSAGLDLFVAHVGHTRAYLWREGLLTLLTRDHTVGRQAEDIRRPVAVERRGQDLRHILTDAVGASGGAPMVEVERFLLQDRDAVLLCTNGLTDVVSEDRIAETLCQPRRSSAHCQRLADLALKSGTPDNVTVVLAQYQMPAKSR